MSFNPSELFSLAQWLERSKPEPPSDALLRTIINRAYYAALISASIFTNTSTLGGHGGVITALKRYNLNIGNKLASLRLKRTNADYEMDVNISLRDANLSLVESRFVLYEINSTDDALTEINMSDYLDSTKFINAPSE